ncbi:uncharacterized protein EI90DRAFT_2941518, partial [Cantharellus anzutake]|uniref:uncharacterized protein n=1 Tax=Cantharellus anzutake TaxID=1750568 RepID=UPI00190520C3
RDLLLFEERLKVNVARLRRKKRKYQSLSFFRNHCYLDRLAEAHPVLLLPLDNHPHIVVSPYITQSAFLIALTTLILFYASGLYAEKISYANRYVPHANRALRSFNMYFNVRTPPPTLPWPFNRFIKPAPEPPATSLASPSGTRHGRGSTTIAPIPPSTNPRGELIFSSRVDRQFREAYERHRAAFERKRDEKALAEAAAAASARLWGWLPGARGKAPASSSTRPTASHDTRSPPTSRSPTPVSGSSKPPTPSPSPISRAGRPQTD